MAVFNRCMNDLQALQTQLFGGIEPENRTLSGETVRVLTHYQFDRSAAAYTLITYGMVWDAEIIVRTIYETAMKVLFIGAHNPPFRDELMKEFWEILPAIFDRKGPTKAEEAEKLRRRFDANEDDIRIFRNLRNPEIFNIEAIHNKKFRDSLESKWSFSEIVRELDKNSDKHIRINGLNSLNHIYGVASHLTHASPKALDLIDDRATRGDDLVALEAGHICRLLSDIVTMSAFGIRYSQRAIDGTQNLASQLSELVLTMANSTDDIQKEFARSQDDYYSKYIQP